MAASSSDVAVLRCRAKECRAKVGDRVERGDDLLGPGASGPLALEVLARSASRCSAQNSSVNATISSTGRNPRGTLRPSTPDRAKRSATTQAGDGVPGEEPRFESCDEPARLPRDRADRAFYSPRLRAAPRTSLPSLRRSSPSRRQSKAIVADQALEVSGVDGDMSRRVRA